MARCRTGLTKNSLRRLRGPTVSVLLVVVVCAVVTVLPAVVLMAVILEHLFEDPPRNRGCMADVAWGRKITRAAHARGPQSLCFASRGN